MVNCRTCGSAINGKFCPQCGAKTEATCNSCDKVITDGKVYDIDGEPHCLQCYRDIEMTISVATARAEEQFGNKPIESAVTKKPAPASSAPSGPKFCSQCGTKVNSGSKFCGQCGNKM